VIEVIVATDESVRLRLDGKEPQSMTLRNVAARVRTAQGGDANTPVVISADKAVRYEAVVRVMDTLQKAGVLRVGLSVKSGA
jgi:biopolymer transport protein TolR